MKGTFTPRIRAFLELIKFSHTIFAMPFALVGTFMGCHRIGLAWPGFLRLGLILLCMVLARTFAMTVNRLVDRRFDAANPRTARRPSVTGEISPLFMNVILVVTGLGFLVATGLFGFLLSNPWPLRLALPVLCWLGLYSFTKRFTALCHFFLGSSLMLAPISAWIAIVPPRGPVLSLEIGLLALGVLLWVGGFDILYALQDEAFDRGQGLHSIPAFLGRRGALWLSRLCHLGAGLALVLLGRWGPFHGLYSLGVGLAVMLLVVEQSLVSEKDISRINLAFMTINGLVGLVFGALAIADLALWR